VGAGPHLALGAEDLANDPLPQTEAEGGGEVEREVAGGVPVGGETTVEAGEETETAGAEGGAEEPKVLGKHARKRLRRERVGQDLALLVKHTHTHTYTHMHTYTHI
jgi:hypothetical protein